MGEPVAHTLLPASGVAPVTPEYVIYTFRKDEGTRSADLWQNMGVSSDITQAREKARTLYQSSRYSRIELRKKFISDKTGAVMDIPVEIFGQNPNREIRNIIVLLSLAMGCAMLAISLSFFLN